MNVKYFDLFWSLLKSARGLLKYKGLLFSKKKNSNKSTNQMQQFYKFITWRFVSLNMFRAPPLPSSTVLKASDFTNAPTVKPEVVNLLAPEFYI